jgi:hypothetical protein
MIELNCSLVGMIIFMKLSQFIYIHRLDDTIGDTVFIFFIISMILSCYYGTVFFFL